MKLNHINLTVQNVQAARLFLETYFCLKSVEATHNEDTFVALKDKEGFVITLMQHTKKPIYPGSFHIGFLKQTEEEVRTLYSRLKTAGYALEEPKAHRGKRLDLYFSTPFGFTIQVSS